MLRRKSLRSPAKPSGANASARSTIVRNAHATTVRITRVHADPSVLVDGKPNYIDPDKWRPLIMSFQRFYGLGAELADSRLARIPESAYRPPDIDRAQEERACEPQLQFVNGNA